MSMHRKNKDSGQGNSNYNAKWFSNSVKRRRKRNLMARLSKRVGRFTRGLMRKARKSYIKRHGFLAQGFIATSSQTVHQGRKYMKLREKSSARGMDGTMRHG